MSLPISACMLSKAFKGDDEAALELIRRDNLNEGQGGFTFLPCKCDPPCPKPTEAEAVRTLRKHARLILLIDKLSVGTPPH